MENKIEWLEWKCNLCKHKYYKWHKNFVGIANRQVAHALKFIFKKVSTSPETIVVLSSHFIERRMCLLFAIAYVNATNV